MTTSDHDRARKAQKVADPEETREEAAARRIDKASVLFEERIEHFTRTLRANAGDLTPYKRQLVAGWLKRHCERLQYTVEDRDAIPPLKLDSLPDYE